MGSYLIVEEATSFFIPLQNPPSDYFLQTWVIKDFGIRFITTWNSVAGVMLNGLVSTSNICVLINISTPIAYDPTRSDSISLSEFTADFVVRNARCALTTESIPRPRLNKSQ